MENTNILFYIMIIFGLNTLGDVLDGFCLAVTGKRPLACLSAYKAEKRRERAIAREERRKQREEKKNAC